MIHHTPHLTTAHTGPLDLLETQILSKQEEIENWFQQQWQKTRAPVYGSVDLRNSGFKLAPVDMNLFPAGFNNLNPEFLPLSIEAARIAIQQYVPEAQKILLIPEEHTRNPFYWQSIKNLIHILKKAGFDVRMGSLQADFSNADIEISKLERKNNLIGFPDFIPDVILLNNDLSTGIPDILRQLDQPILPPAELGWSQRLKSEHFQYYAEVSNEFARFIDIDPWLVAPLFHHCGEIDFMRGEGENCLVQSVEKLLENIQQKYNEYQITCNPFVVVKADAGTYGMAVMTVRSADELLSLNRKQRTSMSKSKGGQPVRKVLLQEGVYTFETWGPENAVAEPVIYMWGERVVGGFYRVHKDRGVDENLNSPGMHFEPLAFVKTCHTPAKDSSQLECQNRFYSYGVIARLSMLAAAKEV